MGEDWACRDEPEGAKVLEQRENRGGGGGGVNVCASPRRKAVSNVAGATTFSTPSIGLSSAK